MSQEQKNTDTRELTFGEELIGISFNPSGNEQVNEVKKLSAQIADTLVDSFDNREVTHIQSKLIDNALMQLVNAQMAVVKALTHSL